MKKIFTYYLKPYYLRMAWGFFIKFSGSLLDLLLPWTLAYMIDTVVPAGDQGQILMWGLFMVVCSVLAAAFSILANRMASRVASDAIYTIREDLFAKVMYLSNHQADEFTRPSLISRLTSDTYNVHQMLGRVQRLGVRAPILLIGGIGMTLILDPVLACVLLATLPPLAVLVVFVSKKSIPLFTAVQESTDRFVRLVREDIAGIRVIKALSRETHEKQRFEKINREVVDRERKATVTTAVTSPFMNVMLNLGLVGVVIAGAFRVNQGTSEVGKILAFMTYFTIILNALMSISRMFIVLSRAAASAGRIDRVLESEDERELFMLEKTWEQEDAAERGNSLTESPCVEFDHVTFSYNKAAENLMDISFQLKRGETLGIIGATGAGKTTIVNLLMRFYDTDQGTVRVDGQDVRDMDIRTLRKKIGAVFQNDVLFGTNIYENINMGRNLSREQAEAAVLYARAEEFVEEKGGVKEHLDIRGANLSGGQKQRLLIARALACHPEILILDDASSALDYKTDAALRGELREHFADTTCLIVAQRISSIMGADHILVLDEGHTLGYGTHRELMESCEAYREIGKSQMGI